MSVQLIVYPQSYDGVPNSISGNSSQMVANPTNFTNALTTLANYSATSTIAQVAVNAIASTMSPNAWYGFVNITTSALIAATNNMLIMSNMDVGVLQKLTNLTVGSVYDVTLTFDSVYPNPIEVKIFNGTTFVSSTTASPSALTATVQFTAPSVNNTIFCLDSISTVSITSVSIISASQSPSGAIQLLENGQVICDLYEDEDLPLTLSVDDFKNVAEKVQSYSKAFNLPSTKRNNKIFNAIFEVTRSDDGLIFNPYKRTQCVLKQDGFILFEGYLRMLDVTDKEGEISYNVNLYSEVIALADTLQDRAFRDLDFTELEHDYNRTQITYSWNDSGTGITYTNPSTSGFRDAYSTVKYPFVDWNHQILIGPGTSGTGANPDNPRYTALEQIFRPFISIKYLIDRIFEASEFTYESAFFDTTDFGKLYMDFNWGADNIPFTIADSGNGYLDSNQLATTSYVTIQTNDNNYPTNAGYSAGVYTALLDNQTYNHDYIWAYSVAGSGAWTIDFRWKMVKGGVTSYINPQQISGSGGSGAFPGVSGNFTEILNTGDTLQPEFKSASSGTHTIQILVTGSIFGTYGANLVNTSASAVTNNIFLQTLRGELGQWEFLKGLITMFNLVTLVDEDNPNNILIEPYSDVFIPTATGGQTLANRGIEHDWTDKIDVSEMKLTPLTDLNRKTIFKFVEDDDDYSFNQYKNQVGGHLYGSKKYNAGNEFNILDGKEEVIAEPFAATVVKPLMSEYPDIITPAIYAMNGDVEEGFENSPRIMFNNGIKSTGASYYIPAQNGVTSINETNYLQFSHIKDGGTSISNYRDFHFGECQLLGNQATTVNNLFNLYWLPYYSELYNPNTRTMTLKVNLSPADINTFKFNDRVFIKNRVFRVNKIDYKPNDLATVEFILIP